jgi:hypothetical protein
MQMTQLAISAKSHPANYVTDRNQWPVIICCLTIENRVRGIENNPSKLGLSHETTFVVFSLVQIATAGRYFSVRSPYRSSDCAFQQVQS